MNKLDGLPTIHYISLEESLDRRTNLENWFQKYNITNYVPHLFKRFEKYNHNLIGTNVHLLAEHSKGPITSHLRLLRELYETYDDEYFLIVEDDLSLETVEHWNFTWKQFYQNLPKDWNGIQLTIVREYNVEDYSFEERKDKDWCVAGYLIKRNYVKYLLDSYYFDDDFKLDTSFIPVVEDVLFFHTNPNIYCFPLFVEDFYNAKSTYRNPELIDDCHHKSYHNVLNWWENKGKNLTINQIMNTQLNHIYQESQFGENWFSYPNLYRKMVEKFPSGSKFVEIGSWKGKSSAFMAVEIANSNKNIEFYCVDTWEGSVEHQDRDDLKSLYDTFNQNMMPLKDYHIPLKIISLEAVEKFEDKSLDFVFIDASHEYEDVKKDIISWLPKVKEGGIIAGHDYYLNGTDFFPGVKQAVNETLKSNELEFAEDCWIYQVKLVSNELIEYSLDTENAKKNYNLAKWYESQGHTAPAHSYYLRAAERSEDNLLAYSALIRGSFCYGAQKSRDSSEKVLLENALVLLPKRPEAYYFLSLIYERKQEWQHSYIYATLGLKCYEDDTEFANINIPEYSGKHLLIFQKAISSWWWGRGDESRELLELLYDNYWDVLDEKHKFLVEENAKKVGAKLEKRTTFQLSVNQNNTSWIVDNFYESPDEVRKFALEQEYVEGGFGRGFIGRRTEQQFLFPGLKERFEEIMGRRITEWESHGMNGRFQVAWSGEPLVYHCDSQQWGGMLYLTPDAPYQCGTTLYAHKQTRARTYYDEGWDAAWKDVPGDPHLDGTSFEPVDVLGNVYNRLVIFDASAIHSASQYFGTVMENARLWQMFFFNTD
jgi:predicted O-methyltransferase YrrM/GR25 family glycosyltransferase involved in LPS biosynthesis